MYEQYFGTETACNRDDFFERLGGLRRKVDSNDDRL
jgi:hypothetical protein